MAKKRRTFHQKQKLALTFVLIIALAVFLLSLFSAIMYSIQKSWPIYALHLAELLVILCTTSQILFVKRYEKDRDRLFNVIRIFGSFFLFALSLAIFMQKGTLGHVICTYFFALFVLSFLAFYRDIPGFSIYFLAIPFALLSAFKQTEKPMLIALLMLSVLLFISLIFTYKEENNIGFWGLLLSMITTFFTVINLIHSNETLVFENMMIVALNSVYCIGPATVNVTGHPYVQKKETYDDFSASF